MAVPAQLERMMFGFIESQVLFVCDEIKLFDLLAANGPSTLQQIANELSLPESSLERILICAQATNLIDKDGSKFKIKDEDLIPFLSRKSKSYCALEELLSRQRRRSLFFRTLPLAQNFGTPRTCMFEKVQ